MNDHDLKQQGSAHGKIKHGRGPSSYRMQDPELVFGNLSVKPGGTVLDLGCGPGDYSERFAEIVGQGGKVFALDRWDEALNRVKERKIANIVPVSHDITRPLPLDDHCADLCLMATVLHALNWRREDGQAVFGEVLRVLKPGGELAIIECKKEDQPWGPPKEVRMSPDEVESVVAPCGFEKSGLVDLGVMYMIKFRPVA